MSPLDSSPSTELPRRSLLVVAHPDDEILWFSSVLQRMATVVVCFLDYRPEPALGQGRRRALAAHPLPQIRCLGRVEAGSLDHADWSSPVLEAAGLRLDDVEARFRYRGNARWLRRKLPAFLDEHDAVFTHNPWGEYGHEDHVQLHSVLRDACTEAGLDLWVPAWCGPKARHLARRFRLRAGAPHLVQPTDPLLAARIQRVYQRHGCWTWEDTWPWPRSDLFYRSADLEPLPAPATGRQRSGPPLEWIFPPDPVDDSTTNRRIAGDTTP